jgi:hypothetical protein
LKIYDAARGAGFTPAAAVALYAGKDAKAVRSVNRKLLAVSYQLLAGGRERGRLSGLKLTANC